VGLSRNPVGVGCFRLHDPGLLVPRNPGLEDTIPLELKNRIANVHENGNGTAHAAATGCRCNVKITSGSKEGTVLELERPWSPKGVALRDGRRLRARMDPLERWPQRWLAPARSKNHQPLICRFTIRGPAIIL